MHENGKYDMELFYQVLLKVWREACRNIELDESTPIITALLQEDIPLKQVLVKRIGFESGVIETVAHGSLQKDLEISRQTEPKQKDLKRLKRWLEENKISHIKDKRSANVFSFLFENAEPTGSIMLGPLVREEVTGILIFVAPGNVTFSARCEMLFQTLLEPFAVAFENDMRLRELKRLRKAAEADKRSLLNRLGRKEMVDTVVGQTTGLKAVIERVCLVSESDVPILILGETGTGKELIARMIHDQSDRAGRPFIRINCGAIPSELIDSQLFGHVKGAFTGAVADRAGWFERADAGTLFLDEIGELPLAAQVRFLRVLQDGLFERVGDNKTLHVNVRIIAATNQDLSTMVTEGRFREDLWYRIAVFPIILPPLRQRLEDIPDLAEHFVNRAACRFRLIPVMPSEEEIQLLQSYDWPGNIREFASVLDRASILGNGKTLEISKSLGWTGEQFPETNQDTGRTSTDQTDPQSVNSQTLDVIMRCHIEKVLSQTKGRIDGPDGAAVRLGINPHTLRGRMRKLGINWKAQRNLNMIK